MTAPVDAPPAARSDWRIIVAIVGVLLSVLGPLILPVENRVTAALTCPRSTRSAIVAWETGASGGGNGTRFQWTVYCVRDDGFAVKPGDFGVIAKTMGASLLVLTIVLGAMTARRRAR